MATRHGGKPYIWVTWVSALLGGDQCRWAAWFKAHYRYDKHENFDLSAWRREHDSLVRARREELEATGETVTVEDENAFKLEGEVAILAGKPDLLSVSNSLARVVDCKTGRESDKDWWQVLLYLFALQRLRKDLPTITGELQYGTLRVPVSPSELTQKRELEIVRTIRMIAAVDAPLRAPSASECRRCNIGPEDCPERVDSDRTAVRTEDF